MSRSVIGFHYGPEGDAYKRGIGDFMRRLNEKGIPFFMTGADQADICFEGQDWGEKKGVSNWLVYRTSTEGQKDGNDYDMPDYSKSPEEAAEAHWRITLPKWPKELKPDVVWMEPVSEPRAKPDDELGIFEDMHPVDWLGRFMLAYARIANNASPSFKVCGPSFNSGEPKAFGSNEYELPGMLAYLSYCAANPDNAALSVHEYIGDRWENGSESWRDWYPELWGRVEAAFAAARRHNIPLDFQVFVTEWGFSFAHAPRWPECEPFLKHYDSWAARWPQVKGAAAWSLQGARFFGTAEDLHTWIGPLTDYILNNDFPRGSQPAELHNRFDDTAPVAIEPAEPAAPGGLAYEVRGLSFDLEQDFLQPGQSFSPTWTLRNSGSQAWTGEFQVAYVDRTLPQTQNFARAQMAGKASFSLMELTGQDRVGPGEKIEISLKMTAPDDPGFQASHWELRNAAGQAFGGTRFIFIKIKAVEQLSEAAAAVPATPLEPAIPLSPSRPNHDQKVTSFTGPHGSDDGPGNAEESGLPAYVNLILNDLTEEWAPRELDLDEGFFSGRRYGLTAAIDLVADIRYAGPGEQPPLERPDVEEEIIELTVALLAEPEEVLTIVGDPLATLEWPKDRPSIKNAEFLVEANAPFGQTSGRLDLYFYYQTNLLYTTSCAVEVQPPGYVWPPDGRGISWVHLADDDRARSTLFRRFAYLNHLAPRGANLAIQPGDKPEEYRVTAYIGRAELPGRVKISRAELNSQLVKMRAEMDGLRREPFYVDGAGYDAAGAFIGDLLGDDGAYGRSGLSLSDRQRQQIAGRYQEFLDKMALMGSLFWDKLFGYSESGRLLRRALEEHLEEGDIVQIWIDLEASEFVFPWTWLYPKSIMPDETADRSVFWGYRYVIEQLPQYVETARRPPPDPEMAVRELDVKMGIYKIPPLTDAQVAYLSDMTLNAGSERFDVWLDDETWEAYLRECQSHILYYYAHGHTAKPVSLAGQQFYDMVAGQRQWLDHVSADEPEWMVDYRLQARQYLDELDDGRHPLDESYILLDNGILLQRRLQEMDLWATRPLVFLNMCESAQVFPDISEGIIDTFLKQGARSVIGTEIPMLARFADLFSRRFFDLVIRPEEPASIGRALYELRRYYLDRGNPLAFAYTLYGDATTRVVLANNS